MTRLLSRGLAVSLILATAAACTTTGSGSEIRPPLIRQITQSAHCGLSGPGVAVVKSLNQRDVLLDVPGQNMATDAVRRVVLANEHLIFVTLGQKPTAGYSLGLSSSEIENSTLVLEMALKEPAPGMIVAQVITSPCVVLAAEPGQWQSVQVNGLGEQPIMSKPGN
ncbi:hypothetical protein C7H09_11960 [Marinobacter fuscus]|uniref:PrcB C-terminal domain-containing protein n=1 Tax=Marinobacter fuscus TaxID=2109942 RepID=A0A2T1K7N7_9GAMM|nr:protease complex subunit PrcB family protein [Marinobacter fuscus]PSF06048.1 hypothetical protein C7H09_11960 [Marinobacter fuscus]